MNEYVTVNVGLLGKSTEVQTEYTNFQSDRTYVIY